MLTNENDSICKYEIDRSEFGIKIENIDWDQNIKCSVVLDFIGHIQNETCENTTKKTNTAKQNKKYVGS